MVNEKVTQLKVYNPGHLSKLAIMKHGQPKFVNVASLKTGCLGSGAASFHNVTISLGSFTIEFNKSNSCLHLSLHNDRIAAI